MAVPKPTGRDVRIYAAVNECGVLEAKWAVAKKYRADLLADSVQVLSLSTADAATKRVLENLVAALASLEEK